MQKFTLRINFLGVPEVFKPSGQKLEWEARRQSLKLLAYLTLSGGTVMRTEIADAFWGPVEDMSLRRKWLRQILRLLRQTTHLNERQLIGARDFIALDPHCYELDVDRFSALRRRMDAEEEGSVQNGKDALDLYRNHFLRGYDTDHLADWICRKRWEFACRYLEIARKVVGLLRNRNHVEDAEAISSIAHKVNMLFAVDSLPHLCTGEHGNASLLRNMFFELFHFQTEVNNFTYIIFLYDTYKELMNTFGSGAAADSMQALYENARRQNARPVKEIRLQLPDGEPLTETWKVHKTEIQLPLAGREKEKARLLGAIGKSVSGTPAVVWVTGEVGIGKTRLIKEAAAELSRQGSVAVCRGKGTANGLQPYGAILGPVKDALRLMLLKDGPQALVLRDFQAAVIAGLVPEFFSDEDWFAIESLSDYMASVSPREGSMAVRNTLVSLITRLARQTNVVVVIDDLQDADASSLACLLALLDIQNEVGLAIVVASRASADASLGWLREEMEKSAVRKEEIHLRGMSLCGVARLVSGVFKDKDTADKVTRSLFERRMGNPLFILETLRGLLGKKDITDKALRELPLPTSVRHAVHGRLPAEETLEREVLHACVVYGHPCDSGTLRAVCALRDSRPAARAIGKLVRQGWLQEDRGIYRIAHPLYAEVIYDDIGPDERRLFHLRCAETLQRELPAGAFRVAAHLEAGGRYSEAARCWLEAARQAWELFADGDALDFLKRGLALASDGETRFTLYAERNEIEHHLGRIVEQAESLAGMGRAAAAENNARWLATTAYRRGRWLSSQSRWPEAEAELRRALEWLHA